MGKWIHRLKNKDLEKHIADCDFCGKVKIVDNGGIWKCINGRRVQTSGGGIRRKKLKAYRGQFLNINNPSCENCGILNKDIRFFDVNHKDGNSKNNSKFNLELLCPNCHRLETIKLWDSWKKK